MNAAVVDPQSKPNFRFSMRSLLATILALSFLFAGVAWIYHTIVAPHRRADAVEELLRSLVSRRPSDMSRGQWGSAVAWTLNLHSNSLLMFEADGPTIGAFEDQLQAKLAGDVDMQTIHWIWDEYANLCPHGASYQRFKPQMMEEIASIGPGADPWGMHIP